MNDVFTHTGGVFTRQETQREQKLCHNLNIFRFSTCVPISIYLILSLSSLFSLLSNLVYNISNLSLYLSIFYSFGGAQKGLGHVYALNAAKVSV